MFFNVSVPGLGDIFVEAGNESSAVVAVQQFLNRNRIRLEDGDTVDSVSAVDGDQIADGLLLNGNGVPIPLEQTKVSPNGQRLFRFDVPVIGDLFVVADTLSEAQIAGQEHVAPFAESTGFPVGFQLGSPEAVDLNELPMNADPNFVIDSTGAIRDDLLGGFDPSVANNLVLRTEPGSGDQGTSTQLTQNVSSLSIFVGKIVGENGVPRFLRVASTSTDQARAMLESVFGASVIVQVVSTPEFLFENDPDFQNFIQESGFLDLESFVRSLELINVPPLASEDDDPDDDTTTNDPISELPVDVQSFPFASFQNAVAGLGLDPEGVLGSTISQRFNALAPAAQIGSLTGTVDPIGQDPGALEQFFSDRFGDLDLAADTFRDLLAGTTGGDLSADQLLSFQALLNPDIATGRGRGDAADVFRLARAAAANRFGSFVASRLLPSNARLFRELERQLAEGDLDLDFLEFARQQNLLPV